MRLRRTPNGVYSGWTTADGRFNFYRLHQWPYAWRLTPAIIATESWTEREEWLKRVGLGQTDFLTLREAKAALALALATNPLGA